MFLLDFEEGVSLLTSHPLLKKKKEEEDIPSRENSMCEKAIWAGDKSGEGLGSGQSEPCRPW